MFTKGVISLRPQEVNQQKRQQRDIDTRLITDTRVLPAQVRLIDSRPETPDDQKSRVISQYEAHRLRLDTGLDLIMLDKDVNPPVIKLLDYGKFKFEEEKRKKETARKQHEQARGLKEFFFSVNIGTHDYGVKLNHLREALEKNYDIRIGVKKNFDNRSALKRGQTLEQAAREPGFVLRRVLEDLGDAVKASTWTMGDRVISINLKRALEK